MTAPIDDALRATLAAAGYPLVLMQADGVLVCKEGTWVHGATLHDALAELDVKVRERAAARAAKETP